MDTAGLLAWHVHDHQLPSPIAPVPRRSTIQHKAPRLPEQVTDTPGLLARPDEERNRMELLTLAALRCLPTSVLFVMDLTEECGTSVADQWAIRCGSDVE